MIVHDIVLVVHAATDDGITHVAELHTWHASQKDVSLLFRCRTLLIDGHGEAHSHIRSPDDLVDCMTCLVLACNR